MRSSWAQTAADVFGFLAAGDGDQGSLGEMGLRPAAFAGAHEVAGVDGGGGELACPARVGASPGPPRASGPGFVGPGGEIARLLEGVAAAVEVLGLLGEALEFEGGDLASVLFADEFLELRLDGVGGAVEAGNLCMEAIHEAPKKILALVFELGPVPGDGIGEQGESLADPGEGFLLVPDIAGVGLVGIGPAAMEFEIVADGRGGRGALGFGFVIVVIDENVFVHWVLLKRRLKGCRSGSLLPSRRSRSGHAPATEPPCPRRPANGHPGWRGRTSERRERGATARMSVRGLASRGAAGTQWRTPEGLAQGGRVVRWRS